MMANLGRKLQGGSTAFIFHAIVIPLLLFWCAQAFADEWTTEDTHREMVYAVLVVTDWRQTQDIARHQNIEEVNEILGEHPTNGQINRYFLVATAMQFAIAYTLPADWRRSWQSVGIGFELAFVLNNKHAGLRIDF
jgi:hypothetical protein